MNYSQALSGIVNLKCKNKESWKSRTSPRFCEVLYEEYIDIDYKKSPFKMPGFKQLSNCQN